MTSTTRDRPRRSALFRGALAPTVALTTAVAAFSPVIAAQADAHTVSSVEGDRRGAAEPASVRAPVAEIAALAQQLRAAAQAAGTTYAVEAGDTVWSIATYFEVRVTDVLAWNGLDRGSIIYPGDTLIVAEPAAAEPTPAAVLPRSPAGASHTVRAGDTLWAIADAHGLSVTALFGANGLSGASIIYPGDELIIPSSEPILAPGLDAEQSAHAQLIIRVGRDLGISDRGIAIALATAMVESWLRNLDWGDRDSAGLFQQRPSQGWGTSAEVQDPQRATRVFFGGESDPNGDRTRGLLDIPGWEALGFAEAAQAVQISAYPDRYAEWEQDAYAWIEALG